MIVTALVLFLVTDVVLILWPECEAVGILAEHCLISCYRCYLETLTIESEKLEIESYAIASTKKYVFITVQRLPERA